MMMLPTGSVVLVLDQARSGGAQFWGLLAVLLATAAWGVDNTLSRALAERDPSQVVMAKAALGATAAGILVHEHTHEVLEHERAHRHDDGHHDHLHDQCPLWSTVIGTGMGPFGTHMPMGPIHITFIVIEGLAYSTLHRQSPICDSFKHSVE